MDDSMPNPSDVGSWVTDAQAGLGALVSVSVDLRREAAALEARRLTAVHEVIEYAVRESAAFVSPRGSAAEQRELARRAAIAELAVAWRVSERSMQRVAAQAHALCTALPATLAAMHDGRIDAAHGRVIADATCALEPGSDLLARIDAELAEVAATMTPGKLRHAANRLLETLQASTLEQRHARAFDERCVELESARDGMAWLAIQLRASDALLIRDRLQQTVSAASADPTELRTAAQLEADLARDLLLHAVPPAGAHALVLSRVRPTVHVTVPVMSLIGTADTPADLDGYGPIDPDTARQLAAQAPSFVRLLTHPVAGTVLDVDRQSYRVPADLRKWLQVRDGTCRFPGCARRPTACDVDHSEDWAADHGATAHDNLAHLCRFHHRLKHETAWSLRHLDGAVLEWTSLTGTTYRTTPAGNLRTAPPHNPRPADPVDPVDPADPVDPVDPVDPAEPAEPADPAGDTACSADGAPERLKRQRRPPQIYETSPAF